MARRPEDIARDIGQAHRDSERFAREFARLRAAAGRAVERQERKGRFDPQGAARLEKWSRRLSADLVELDARSVGMVEVLRRATANGEGAQLPDWTPRSTRAALARRGLLANPHGHTLTPAGWAVAEHLTR